MSIYQVSIRVLVVYSNYTFLSYLIMQLVSLEVCQSVLGPILKLVPSNECHNTRIPVLTAATTYLHTHLKLPV